MKRCALRICAFLVLGAIVNVAVAWGIKVNETRIQPPGPIRTKTTTTLHKPPRAEDLAWWSANAPPGFESVAPIQVIERRGFGGQSLVMLDHEISEQNVGHMGGVRRLGWPCLALESEFWVDLSTGHMVVRQSHYIPDPYPGAGYQMPTRPMWAGFTINSVFYAGFLLLLVALLLEARRRLRIWRGLCAKCAYDLRGSSGATCPECGAVA